MSVRPVPSAPAAATTKTVPKGLEPRLLKAAESGPTDAIVFFNTPQGKAHSATSALMAAEALPRGDERKSVVFNALNQISSATQQEHSSLLDKLKTSGAVQGVDELWSMNAVRLRGATADALRDITAGANVQAVVPDEIVALPIFPNAVGDSVNGAKSLKAGGKDDAVYIGWGVEKMKAAEAWKQGITGAGLTIASLDTGVITDHPGLKANYRGTKADGSQDHNHNWYNGIEKDKVPMDDVGHGTHTIGNSVGYHPNHIIGVAPDAKFIAARGLGNAGGSLFSMLNSMQWMLAPTDLNGKNPKPELAPDIVTNSWGGAGVANPFLWMALRNWRRAGIVPVFAAGNTRPPGAVPGSIASPGLHEEALTVGATDKNDERASFSNRGPSNFAKDVKPEVVAPGVKIYSAWTDGTFRDTFVIDGKPYQASGTSMATPHVAGAVALYMQAHPNASFDEIRQALEKTATHPKSPDNDTGYGRVQVDKLISDIDPNAKRTPKARVDELMAQVAKAKVFESDDQGNPTTIRDDSRELVGAGA